MVICTTYKTRTAARTVILFDGCHLDRGWVLATYLLGEHRMRSLLEPPNKQYPTFTPLVLITSGKNGYYNSIWHYEHPSRLYLTPHN